MEKNTKRSTNVSNKKSGTSNSKKKSNNGSNIQYSGKVTVKERKKKRKVARIIFFFVIFGAMIAGVYLLLTLKAFNLENVELNETMKYSKEDIVNKAGIEVGKNIFIEYFTSDKKAVTTLPYVESIKLKLKLPNEIKIDVVERTSKYFAYDKDNNKFFSLSDDGYILEEVDISSKKNDEILLTGVTFDDEVMLGKKINDTDLSKIEIYKKIEKEFKKDEISGKITKVSFENSLTTITINDKLNIIFPNDTDLEYKMVFLKTILKSIAEDSVGVIDMTKTRPTYSSF
ncbi:pOTRA domain protein FtsQ-type [Clostridium sp. CAG:465]|nr:pOTRA domain protein FtsQ-type [Clostridium sp. CAG:465]